jgi:hypothetical protein
MHSRATKHDDFQTIVNSFTQGLRDLSVVCWRGLGRVIKEERYPQSQRIK